MNKNYTYIFLIAFLFFGVMISAQEIKSTGSKEQNNPIESLSVYPNPCNTGKIYITSKLNDEKKVEVHDVLGKKIIDIMLHTKELNVSNLNPGVYIIKIKEGEASSTRKLIIN